MDRQEVMNNGAKALKKSVTNYPWITLSVGFGLGLVCGSKLSKDVNKLLFRIGSKTLLKQFV